MDFEDHKPTIFMILLQVMYAAITLATRASLLQGLSPRIFVVYRQATATLLIAPLAYLARKSNSCHLGWKNFSMIFLISLIGATLNNNLYAEDLYLASSSISSAMGNLVPAITFIMAYITGMEKVNVQSLRSIAKIIGTVICVTGAIGMVLFKGSQLLNKELLPIHSFGEGGENWLLGCLLLLASNFCWSLWMILQVPMSASYPDHLSLTAWMCFIATLQSASVNIFIEPNLEVWKLHSYQELGCCFFTAAGSAISFFTQAWSISRRGPLFSAMFSPLVTVIVTISACIFLHEEMYVGSLIRSLAVIFGLYIVLWGKAKDHEESCKRPEECSKQASINNESSDMSSCRIDMEDPLLIA